MTDDRAEKLAKLRANQTLGPDHPELVHRQVLVQHGSRGAWVDEGAARMIRHFWRHGVDTVGSCEDIRTEIPDDTDEDLPVAYVAFPAEDYPKMLELLNQEPDPVSEETVVVVRHFRHSDRGFTIMDSGAHVTEDLI